MGMFFVNNLLHVVDEFSKHDKILSSFNLEIGQKKYV